LKLRDW